MFNLPENNIHLAVQATNKQQAIEMVAAALERAGYVESGYLQGMLARELQTSTFLGNGIAIPHGTLETRSMVKDTGVQIFQFPQGIEWGEGNIAYVVIGIAARSDEHLTLLRQLTHVLGDEDVAAQLATLQDVKKFRAILMGESDEVTVKSDDIHLNIDTQSLLTLIAVNVGHLQQQSAVDNQFVSEVIATPALPLGKGLWLTDSVVGNLKNALAFSRAGKAFDNNGKTVNAVLTIAAKDDRINAVLARLLEEQTQEVLLNGNVQKIVDVLNGVMAQSQNQVQTDALNNGAATVIGTFTVRNEHGLHARPAAVLVNEVKKYNASVAVQNLDRETQLVSAKSLMKVVALGVVKGHRLRFVATGEDAQKAIQGIGAAIEAGLGE